MVKPKITHKIDLLISFILVSLLNDSRSLFDACVFLIGIGGWELGLRRLRTMDDNDPIF